MTRHLDPSELAALLIGVVTLIWGVGVLLFRRLGAAKVTPDPWGAEVTAELERDECPQLCHHCLTQLDSGTHLCPHCGAMVGTCTALMPPLNLYSIGPVFRSGVEGQYRRSAWLIAGYFLMGVVYLYWIPVAGLVVMLFFWGKLLASIPRRIPKEDQSA